MSDLNIALIAEGKTDFIVIEAALKAILDRPFVLKLLQPETSDAFGGAGPYGGGWGGVYRWCRQLVSMECPVAANPSLAGYDLVLVHVDADVAGMCYEDANIDEGRTDLPCERPCPPPEDSVNALRDVVAGWLDLPGQGVLPERWAFCNPSKCSEAWVVAALYGNSEPLFMTGIECNPELENWLSQRPVRERRIIRSTKKQTSAYRSIAHKITDDWLNVCGHCAQAGRFGNEVMVALNCRQE
jgi:hypothetical protein